MVLQDDPGRAVEATREGLTPLRQPLQRGQLTPLQCSGSLEPKQLVVLSSFIEVNILKPGELLPAPSYAG